MTPKEFKNARQSLGLSQSKMSHQLEVSFQTVQAWEQGRNPINKVVELAIKTLLKEIKMIVVKEDDGWYQYVRTGIRHPKDNEVVEFRVRKHVSGGFVVLCPDLKNPDLDHEIACEPSNPRAQELIDQANLLQLGKSARYEVINYYSGNDDLFPDDDYWEEKAYLT